MGAQVGSLGRLMGLLADSAAALTFGLAESLSDDGHALTLCCLQDAVLLRSTRVPAGARAALGRLLDRGARCVALRDDLVLRGVRAGEHASTVDHAGMIALLAADHDRVLGAF